MSEKGEVSVDSGNQGSIREDFLEEVRLLLALMIKRMELYVWAVGLGKETCSCGKAHWA